MNNKGNRYTREFKLEALQLLEHSGKSRNAIEKDLGISRGCLKRWQQEFAAFGDRAFPGKGNERLGPEQEEIRRLKRENDILRLERDILKKAIAIFSQTKR
ncbi:MAG: transposase [Anaerolineales bacterium]|jgi:transposase|nr:transposase [Anaerolineales bacterium]